LRCLCGTKIIVICDATGWFTCSRDLHPELKLREKMGMANIDRLTVEGFGEEWSRYDQTKLSPDELEYYFGRYFSTFPWHMVGKGSVGFDLGCGSGRWARLVAPKVGLLHCIDASEPALSVAKRSLASQTNCAFHHATVDEIPLPDSSMDFGYSLGVLHHVPDTAGALQSCVRKLKPGAPFLVYLYYRFDNRPPWFRRLWELSDRGRQIISRMPAKSRHRITEVIAATVYLPLARCSNVLERLGTDVSSVPLSSYRRASFYTMRTDALDRFGTRLEQRFTRAEIAEMMRAAGLEDIKFSENGPFWCASGLRRTTH